MLASVGLQASPLPKEFVNSIKLDVVKYKLDNGMVVLLNKDNSVPMVSVHQWYRVGSKNEVVGKTGLAHFFEHLMFKGTKKYPAHDLEFIIQSNGGSNNAFTSRDYTGYYISLPSDKLELALDIESDRMVNLQFDMKAINSEREVVKEERRMRVENSISGSIWEAMFKSIFKVNQYRWPVIGYMRDLNAATMKDFKDFYKTYYSPNNSVLVVSGDINISNAKSMIEKYYGKLQPQKIPAIEKLSEPEQKGHRTTTLRKNAQSSTFMVGYQGPNVEDADLAAMEVLSYILGNGDSSRLHQRLVYRTQLANSTWAFTYSLAVRGAFLVNVAVKPGADLNKAISAAYGEIYKVRAEKVKEEELTKARNMLVSELVDRLKTTNGVAQSLAAVETITGDYTRLFSDIEKYSNVTVDDIQRVAKKYLKPDQRSIVMVVPKGS
tara:strand:- start:48254 stop:49561 length:1308 start_codon:yes stop_codon:yes gene_type:complete